VVATPDALAGRDGGNIVVLASTAPLPVGAVEEALTRRAPALGVLAGGDVATFTRGAQVLTDDDAPVDQLLTP
jgi:hypothetical protein